MTHDCDDWRDGECSVCTRQDDIPVGATVRVKWNSGHRGGQIATVVRVDPDADLNPARRGDTAAYIAAGRVPLAFSSHSVALWYHPSEFDIVTD